MHHVLRAAAVALVVSAIPTAALAATPASGGADQTYQLTTVEAEQYGVGVVDGRMRITVRPDGIIQGTYENEDTGTPHVVTGGLEPDGAIWFEIGDGALPRRFVGTFRDGQLHSTLQASHDGDIVHLDATPR